MPTDTIPFPSLIHFHLFPELALLNHAPRAASIVAARSTSTLRVATLSEKAFTRLLGPLAGIMSRHAEEHYGTSSTAAASNLPRSAGSSVSSQAGGLNQNVFAAGMGGLSQGVGPHDNSGTINNKTPGDGTWIGGAGYSPFGARS